MLEPTCRALCYSVEGCLSGVGTYLPGTVLQWCRLLSKNKPVLDNSDFCLIILKIRPNSDFQNPFSLEIKISLFLPVLSLNCLSSVRTYLPGTVLQWCRLFKHSQNLPAAHCVAGVQTV